MNSPYPAQAKTDRPNAAHHTACPGCRTYYYLRPTDLGQRSICRNCGQSFYLLPPSASPPTIALLENPDRSEEARHLVGRLWLDLRQGQILDGVFMVHRPLGRGGLSQIFQVRDIERDLDLAVKLPLAASLDRLPLKVFINEAEAWLKPARHPNLVSCDQVRFYSGQPIIFMEYIKGLDLARLTAEGRGAIYQGTLRASCLQLLDIFIQVARGLKYAHDLNLKHLDLKPRNVLVESGGRALIGDFGHLNNGPSSTPEPTEAKVGQGGANQETRISGTRLLGTPQYFSPEMAAGRPDMGCAADLWALALTILECFLGRRPWEMGSTVGRALEQYLTEGDRPTYLPAGLMEYFRQALALQPDGRFKDAESVARRLSEIYEEVAGQPYGRPPAKAAEETQESLARKNASFRQLRRLDRRLD